MISSQCNRRFPDAGRTLSEIRQTLRDRLENEKLFGHKIFKVWINEDAPPAGTDENSWETCLSQARSANVFLALNSGSAGWSRSGGDIGICHAELMAAQDTAPAKIRIIPLQGTKPEKGESAKLNENFAAALDRINAFSPAVSTEEQLVSRALDAVADVVSKLVHLGIREGKKGNYYSGDALAWSRLSYSEREDRMVAALEGSLEDSGGRRISDGDVLFPLTSGQIAFRVHAAPAGLAIPASRERVGRPFLNDHIAVSDYPKNVGPLHLVACHAGATEAQARTLIGHPDATLVRAPFGVFAADEIQKVQFALLKDCRDETTTRHALHRFLDWLRESGEDEEVVGRAMKRRAIAEAIAKQQT